VTFTAKLKRTSTIWTTWREAHRISGEVSGVMFRLTPNLDYVAGALDTAQIEALRVNAAVQLEMVADATTTQPIVDSLNTVLNPPPAPTVLVEKPMIAQEPQPRPPPPTPPPPPPQLPTPPPPRPPQPQPVQHRPSPFQPRRNGRH
jgi:hypothetical protein